MEYKIINLYNLEELKVCIINNYCQFIGKKNNFINDPTNLKLKIGDKNLIYIYYLDYEFYIPKYMLNNSCFVFIDKYTLLINIHKYKNKIMIFRMENNLAFKIYYQRLIELRNIGINKSNIIFDNFNEKINGYEKILINYCFEILDISKDKNTLIKALLFLINPTFKLQTNIGLIKLIQEPCSNLQNSIYGIKWDLLSNIESILKKLGLNLIYNGNNINLNKTLDLFATNIINFYNYEYEFDYPKKYKCFID